MAKQDDYIRITARIPPEVHDALVELANRTERSLNGELVERLKTAIGMAEEGAHLQTMMRQNVAEYQVGDTANALIELIKSLPEEKQIGLLKFLKD